MSVPQTQPFFATPSLPRRSSRRSDGRDSGLSSSSEDAPGPAPSSNPATLTLHAMYSEAFPNCADDPAWTVRFDLAAKVAVWSKIDFCWDQGGLPRVTMYLRLNEMVVDGVVLLIPMLYVRAVSLHPLSETWTVKVIGKRNVTGWLDVEKLIEFLDTCDAEEVRKFEEEIGGETEEGIVEAQEQEPDDDHVEYGPELEAPVSPSIPVNRGNVPVPDILPPLRERDSTLVSLPGLGSCRFCGLERRPDKLPAHEKYCQRKERMRVRAEFAWTVQKRK